MTVRHVILPFFSLIFFAACGTDGPPYSPQDAVETFRLPEGFRIELAAAEPDVADPVAISFDARGRMFVAEYADYPMGSESGCRIKLLEDTDGDGYFETSTVYADNLRFANSVMAWKEGVLVGAAPDIFYLADTDGDNRADEKRVVLTGFNPYNPQLRMNGLLYAIDNWIYGAYPKVGPSRRHPQQFGQPGEPIHFPDHPEVAPVDISELGMDFRFKPDQFKLEPVTGNSQFGNTFDAGGNRFMDWNSNHIRHAVIDFRYLTRNPYLNVSSAMQFPSDHQDQSIVYPITEDPIFIHESQVGQFTSACGNSVYTGGSFSDKYNGAYFVCEPVHNLVHADILVPDGPTFIARRALEEAEFLASTDPWFKPVFTMTGPDGGLYIADYYRKYVEHPDYVPEGMEGQFDLREGDDKGRIWRVVYDSGSKAPKPQLETASPSDLVKALSHPNMWWRLTAQRLLVDRQDFSAIPDLVALARKAPWAQAQIHALWTLEGIRSLEPDHVLAALGDDDPLVREHAIRLAEGVLIEPVQERLLKMAGDPDERVSFQLACTLGLLPEKKSFEALNRIAARHLDNSWFQIAVLTSASENATRWYREFLGSAEPTGTEEFLGRIAGIVGARQKSGEIAEVLALIGRQGNPSRDRTPRGYAAATLQGLADGLNQGSARQIDLPASTQQVLLDLVQSSSPQVGSSALDVISHIDLKNSAQLRATLNRASETARNNQVPLEKRVNAVRLLGLDPTDAQILLFADLLSLQEPSDLRAAAARALVRIGNPESIQILLDGWRSYTVPVREVVWEGVSSKPDHLRALLDAVEDGRIQPWSLNRSQVARLTRARDSEISRRAQSLFKDLPDDRQEVIRKYRAALTMKGSPQQGRQVFEETCSACHKVGDMGAEVGPDLLNLTSRRSKGFLLIQILDPNLDITPGYESYTIETKDGRLLSGVIANESATSVTLRRRGPE
ncbi:MAG: PVC-type heme-binding CxxCH protein, partial [Acidobacteriota bacterium]